MKYSKYLESCSDTELQLAQAVVIVGKLAMTEVYGSYNFSVDVAPGTEASLQALAKIHNFSVARTSMLYDELGVEPIRQETKEEREARGYANHIAVLRGMFNAGHIDEVQYAFLHEQLQFERDHRGYRYQYLRATRRARWSAEEQALINEYAYAYTVWRAVDSGKPKPRRSLVKDSTYILTASQAMDIYDEAVVREALLTKKKKLLLLQTTVNKSFEVFVRHFKALSDFYHEVVLEVPVAEYEEFVTEVLTYVTKRAYPANSTEEIQAEVKRLQAELTQTREQLTQKLADTRDAYIAALTEHHKTLVEQRDGLMAI